MLKSLKNVKKSCNGLACLKGKRLFFLALLCSLLVIVADQWSKAWALNQLSLHQPIYVTSVLNWILAFNKGAAFSFLASFKGGQNTLFCLFALGVSSVLLVWLYRLKQAQKMQALGLSLVLGGALGNVIDRLRIGAVVDFIQVHYHDYYWPVFNIADSAICLGALLLILEAFYAPKLSDT